VIRILLVDDHPIVRDGIRRILTEGFTAVHVGEAGDVKSARIQLLSAPWDVVVLDVTLPDGSGLDLLKEIRREFPALPVLVLSMHSAAHFARRTLAAGASAYLTKDGAPNQLVGAIEQARKGKIERLSVPIGSTRVRIGPGEMTHDALSNREYQVLRMLGSGRSVSEIASMLHLSSKTVSTYRTRLLEKMQMRSAGEIMRYVIENGLTDS
jgi:two-component system, NarL family, invasion response regulator UvrY